MELKGTRLLCPSAQAWQRNPFNGIESLRRTLPSLSLRQRPGIHLMELKGDTASGKKKQRQKDRNPFNGIESV